MLHDQGLVKLANITVEDLCKNSLAIANGKQRRFEKIQSATWFLPPVTHALKGGVRTVFMFAERMSQKWGCINNFVIYSHGGNSLDMEALSISLSRHFPALRFVLTQFRAGRDNVDSLPGTEIAFCTLWTTAYLLAKYNRVVKKFYFMQDYEPLFYEAGAVYSVIEQTYRMEFSCIANTPGVGSKYLNYSSDVISFYPGVDMDLFYPEKQSHKVSGRVFKVVFYGRPGNPRNCFTLGILTLKALKRKMKHRVQIISVGADWDVNEYGLKGVVENWGLLGSLEEVAELYRSCDAGLVFMVTPHPSYQPLEYMASGCATVTNINEANSWLLNSKNSLLIEPIPEIAAQRIHDLLSDEKQLSSIQAGGLATVQQFSWDKAYSVFESRLLS